MMLLGCSSGPVGTDAGAPDGTDAETSAASGFDEYGGFLDIPVGAPGSRFRLATERSRFWLVTPAGHAFFAVGPSRVSADGTPDAVLGYDPFARTNLAWYGDGEEGRIAFYRDALERVRRIGFTMLASGSNEAALQGARRRVEPIPYLLHVPFMKSAAEAGVAIVNEDGFVDVFDPAFAARCVEAVETTLPVEVREDPYRIGILADRAWHWARAARPRGASPGSPIADSFVARPADSPGKQAFVRFLFEDRGYTLDSLNAAWGTSFASREEVAALMALPDDPAHPAIGEDKAAFSALIAKTYLQAARAAIESVVPGTLFFSPPFDADTPDAVIQAASACDVVSLIEPDPLDDHRTGDRPRRSVADRLARVSALAGQKPLFVSVAGVQAMDAGFQDAAPGIPTVERQADRARWMGRVLDRLLEVESESSGLVVGVELGSYADAPGANTGLVGLDGRPYLTYEDGLMAAIRAAMSRWTGEMRELPAVEGLTVEGPAPRLRWQPVAGATSYEVLLAPDPAFRGVVSRTDWGGARVDGPHDVRWTVTEPEAALDRPLAAGVWSAAVAARANGPAIASGFSAPVEVTMARSCPEEHGTGAQVGCFTMPSQTAGGHAVVYMILLEALETSVPDATFVVSSGAGPAGGEIVLVRDYATPLQGSEAADRFCPAPAIAADGTFTNAAHLIRVRHVTPIGQVVVDRLLDPDGGVAPFSCAGPIPSSGDPIARKVYSVDPSNPLVPRDQRLEVQLH